MGNFITIEKYEELMAALQGDPLMSASDDMTAAINECKQEHKLYTGGDFIATEDTRSVKHTTHQAAHDAIQDRATTYGDITECMTVARRMHTAWLSRRGAIEAPQAQKDIAYMLFLKLSRMAYDLDHQDNYVDAIGYIELMRSTR